MSRQGIRRRFDEIVEFSEIGEFIDMPVKRYSSGMYVRLAFSIAAHIEPDILIVDEVLAVGDVAFQKKCIGRMQDLSQRQGRTILMVSHNPTALRTLCTRGIMVESGELEYDGDIGSALKLYLNEGSNSDRLEWTGSKGNDRLQLVKAWARPAGLAGIGRPVNRLKLGQH